MFLNFMHYRIMQRVGSQDSAHLSISGLLDNVKAIALYFFSSVFVLKSSTRMTFQKCIVEIPLEEPSGKMTRLTSLKGYIIPPYFSPFCPKLKHLQA